MKNSVLTLLLVFFTLAMYAQKVETYNPNADAREDITTAVAKASKEGKHVFLQIGGNWCSWCINPHCRTNVVNA